MNELNEIIHTLLLTGLLNNEKPVSALLVGPSGGGKSLTIMRWRAAWIHHTSDITSAGIVDLLSPDHEGKIRAILIPDFNLPLSHKAAVTTLTVANLLSLMSEGTFRIDDARRDKKFEHAPVGVYSAVTPDMFVSHYRKWKQLGLLRRFLTLNFDYDLRTRCEGNKQIRQGKITTANLPYRDLTPQVAGGYKIFLPQPMALRIETLSKELALHLGYNIRRDYKTHQIKWSVDKSALEFAPHLALQCIARANALKRGKKIVQQTDIDFLIGVLRFTNPAQPGLI